MFSGPGISAFFQPIRAAGPEAVPAQAIAALQRTGDEQKNQAYLFEEKDDAPAPPDTAKAAEDDNFTQDHTELSIDALRALLAGKALPDPAAAPEPDADASPVMRQAAAAYQHAEAVKPFAPVEAKGGFVPPPRDQATASDILLMLAEVETAGIHRIAVRDGASIYDTLAALCWSLQR